MKHEVGRNKNIYNYSVSKNLKISAKENLSMDSIIFSCFYISLDDDIFTDSIIEKKYRNMWKYWKSVDGIRKDIIIIIIWYLIIAVIVYIDELEGVDNKYKVRKNKCNKKNLM